MSGPNIILITVDSLRPDMVSLYGGRNGLTPGIDSLGRDGIAFTNAVTASPITTVSLATILSGAYPCEHGLRNFFHTFNFPWSLAGRLRDAGYVTCSVANTFVFDRSRGFGKDFDIYDDNFDCGRLGERRGAAIATAVLREGKELVDKAVYYIDLLKNKKFFLWFHYYWDTHQPYLPADHNPLVTLSRRNDFFSGSLQEMEAINQGERPFSADDILYARNRVEEGVRYMDSSLTGLFEYLKKEALYNDAFIIFCADHGEGFYEHKFIGHSYILYDEVLRIPLIIKPSGNFDSRYKINQGRLVSTVDIAPTILARAAGVGFDCCRGKDILTQEIPEERVVFSEAFYSAKKEKRLVCARSGCWKAIFTAADLGGEVPSSSWGAFWRNLGTLFYRISRYRVPARYFMEIIRFAAARLRKRRREYLFELTPPPFLFNISRDPLERQNVLAENKAVYEKLFSAAREYLRQTVKR